MDVLSVILKNLLGYDLLIFFVAGLNLWVYLTTRCRATELYKRLRHEIFLPLQPMEGTRIHSPEESFSLEALVSLREHAEKRYAVFTNLTAIFPLLGILGTVVSLIPMVANQADSEANFFAALTSTFWGLVFAIGFKVCDAFLSARMEDNDKNVSLLLSRLRERTEVRQ